MEQGKTYPEAIQGGDGAQHEQGHEEVLDQFDHGKRC